MGCRLIGNYISPLRWPGYEQGPQVTHILEQASWFDFNVARFFQYSENYTKRKRIKSERAHAKYNEEVSANIYTVKILSALYHTQSESMARHTNRQNFPAKTLHHQSCPIQDASQLEYKVHGSWHLLALQIHSMYIMAHLWRAWVSLTPKNAWCWGLQESWEVRILPL
jgi:hypothetical protein